MAVLLRGLHQLRTLSSHVGAESRSKVRHAHLFKLGCLEMERERRSMERHAFGKNIAEIDARLQEIAEEIRRHQVHLGYVADDGVPQTEAPKPGNGTDPAPRRRTLRY